MTMAKEEAPQLFGADWGGDWTEQKLNALNQYLHAYTKALSRQNFHRVYIDAFAGTGNRSPRAEPDLPGYVDIFADSDPGDPEAQEFLDGSASIALKVKPRFDRYVFIELRAARAAELEKLKQQFPPLASSIDIRHADANVAIQSICKAWDSRNERGVLFLDPFGMQVEWQTVQAVATTACIDTWILFPFAVNRLLARYPGSIPKGWRDRLSQTFGTEEWFDRFYTKKTIRYMFDEPQTVIEKRRLTLQGLGAYYHERLQKVFPAVASNPKILYNSRGNPLFQLFFAAANPGRGGKIAIRIAEHILRAM